jgi:hypothetical protein
MREENGHIYIYIYIYIKLRIMTSIYYLEEPQKSKSPQMFPLSPKETSKQN